MLVSFSLTLLLSASFNICISISIRIAPHLCLHTHLASPQYNHCTASHIRNTPNLVSRVPACTAAASESPSTRRVSAGSMTPSSHRRAELKTADDSRSNCARVGALKASLKPDKHHLIRRGTGTLTHRAIRTPRPRSTSCRRASDCPYAPAQAHWPPGRRPSRRSWRSANDQQSAHRSAR